MDLPFPLLRAGSSQLGGGGPAYPLTVSHWRGPAVLAAEYCSFALLATGDVLN
jgi:hypothetical protein